MSKNKANGAIANKWHDGPPPHVGWWNASRTKQAITWRWWDGENWSNAIELESYPEGEPWNYGLDYAVSQKAYKSDTKPIQWHPRYPKNARVPRVAPTPPKIKVTA
jgi:hypothetical protein